jgi:hypothetical protein
MTVADVDGSILVPELVRVLVISDVYERPLHRMREQPHRRVHLEVKIPWPLIHALPQVVTRCHIRPSAYPEVRRRRQGLVAPHETFDVGGALDTDRGQLVVLGRGVWGSEGERRGEKGGHREVEKGVDNASEKGVGPATA